MAITTVFADNFRVSNAETATNWTNIGGGAGGSLENNFYYQGSNCWARKVNSAGIGIAYDGANANLVDMQNSTNRRHVLFKVIVTTYGGTPVAGVNGGCGIIIGSANNAYVENNSISLETYPSKGGWIILPFSPTTSFVTSTVGSPALNQVDYFGFYAKGAPTITAREQNFGIDAIDIGTGLYLIGGGGADPAATFQNFVNFDEGTQTNRFGYVTTNNNIISAFGRLGIGFTTGSVTATSNSQKYCRDTVFNDSARIVLFPDGLYENGYSGLDLCTGTGTTVSSIYMENMSFIGIGTTTTKQPDLFVEGTVGVCTIKDSRFVRFHEIMQHDDNSNVKFLNVTFDGIGNFEHRSGIIDGCVFNQNSVPANVGMLTTFNPENITNTEFNNVDGVGHAIELLSPGTYDLVGITFNNFSGTPGSNLVQNSGSSSAAILNSSGGLITLNVSGGGNQPSIRNSGAGSTTIVNANVTVNINGLPNTVGLAKSTEIRVFDRSKINPTLGITTTEFSGIGTENHTTSTYSFSVGVGATFDVRIINLDYVPFFLSNQSANTDPTNIPVSLISDRVYSDTTPPSGE